MAKNNRQQNAAIVSKIQNANALVARQIGRIMPKANYAQCLQMTIDAVDMCANNNFTHEQEKQVAKCLISVIKNSEVADRLKEILNPQP